MPDTNTAEADESQPLLSRDAVLLMPRVDWFTNLHYTLKIRTLQTLLLLLIQLLRLPVPQNLSIQPTVVKSYPCHPKLKHRIFIPRASATGNTDGKFPLYIDIHGGGFALMDPIVDDEFCTGWCEKHNIVVISVDYPKAPTHRFPSPLNAISDSVAAILEDSDLPIDLTKVAVGGVSAGGNLALGLVQDERLKGKVGGVVALYAPMDFSLDKGYAYKLLEERAREGRATNAGIGTLLTMAESKVLPESDMKMFCWGYAEEGQSLRDPRLSPYWADRENLPEKICIVGCEKDALCWEDRAFAGRVAGLSEVEQEGEELVWEKSGVRWEKILGEDHAFDNAVVAFGEGKRRMRKRGAKMRDDIAAWLIREVYG